MIAAEIRRRRPVEHWWTLAVVTVIAVSALLLHGYATSEVGHASTQGHDHSRPVPAMATAGPVLDLSGSDVRSVSPPNHTIALTFDDGPDGRWTPAILAVLVRYHVPATFFVIGSHAVDHGGLLRREISAGDEIGNHTFTHVDLTREPAWRVQLELRLTQTAIAAAATGRHTILVRPPYSSVASAAATDTLTSWQGIAHEGYLVVVSTLDTEDWRASASVDDIVRGGMPAGANGAVVLMHDGGGNRARTVAALERLIPALRAQGDRFVTIGDLAGIAPAEVMPKVGAADRWQSRMVTSAFWVSGKLVDAFAALALVMLVLLLVRLLLVVVFAPRHRKRLAAFDPTYTPTVTVLVPAYNEEAGITATINSLCRQTYEPFDVVVIDDGSTDNTAAVVQSMIDAGLRVGVRLLQQANAGKANALNRGLQEAVGELIVTVDADTVFEPTALAALVQPLCDERVGAVSGNTKVGNCDRLLGRWQHLEYVMGFNLDRRMYDVLGCIPTVPGAIGAFRASTLAAVGGFSDDTLAEDTDLTMAIQRSGQQVTYEPRAIAWTEAPHGLRDLWRQRYRWSYGTMQSIWKHRGAMTERPSTRLGRIGIPYLILFQIALPILGPLVDLFALYGIMFLDRKLIIAYWLTFTLLQVAICVYALRLDREPVRDVWTLPLQQIVYRQLMYLVVIQSVSTALTGARTHWHKLNRSGTFSNLQSSTAP